MKMITEDKSMIEKMHTSTGYRYALAITSQFYFCGIPFRLDTSPKCRLNCSYCFAMAIGGRNTAPMQFANPEKIRRKLESSLNANPVDITGELIAQKMPIHFGGMSDPFADDQTTNISLQLLNVFASYDYPVVISTKNTEILSRDNVIKVLSTLKKVILQVSFSSFQPKVTKLIEPNSPFPVNRLRTIKQLSDFGFNVFSRIQPYFPWMKEEICNKLIPALHESKVKHIIVEFLKLPVEKRGNPITELSNLLDFDVWNYFTKHDAINMSREWLIPTKIKWEHLQPLIDTIHSYGLTYGSADYGITHLGDTDCCCGLDKIDAFSGYYKGSYTHYIRSKKNQNLNWDEFSKISFPHGSIKQYIMSHSRLKGTNTIYDYLKSKWNHPGTVNAPDTFLGVTSRSELDDQGNCLYAYSEV